MAALRRARGEEEPVGAANGDGSEEEDGGRYVEELVDEMVEKEERKAGKVGTKKLKRIQEKAERKAMREVRMGMMVMTEVKGGRRGGHERGKNGMTVMGGGGGGRKEGHEEGTRYGGRYGGP